MDGLLRVADFDALVSLTSAAQERSFFDNFYLSGGAARRYIELGRLFHAGEVARALTLFADEGAYYNLFVFLCADAFCCPALEKPVIAKIVFDPRRGIREEARIDRAFAAAGFAPFKSALRLSRPITEADAHLPCEGVSTVLPHEVDAFVSALSRSLDPLLHELFIPEELRQRAAAGDLLCIRDDAGQIVAALQGETGRGSGMLLHFAADSAVRGRGYGTRLANAYFKKFQAAGVTRCSLWVEHINEGALRLYDRLGFVPDSREVRRYIKKG